MASTGAWLVRLALRDMVYVLTNGQRSVLTESQIHRDAYLSSGWWEVAAPTNNAEVTPVTVVASQAAEPPVTVAKKRVGRPRREV